MKWDHRFWEIGFLKPPDFSRKVWFKYLWSILPGCNPSKISKLDPLYRAIKDKWLSCECHIVDLYSDFFSELTKCALTKKFIIFHLSTRKCPISRPSIDMHSALDKKHMITMFTDDMRRSWEIDTWHIIFQYWYFPRRLWEHSQFSIVDCSSYKWAWWVLLFWSLLLWVRWIRVTV